MSRPESSGSGPESFDQPVEHELVEHELVEHELVEPGRVEPDLSDGDGFDGVDPEQELPRKRRTNPLGVVIVLVLAMAFYFALIGVRGVYLLGEHRITLKVLGVAVLVLPLVGIWVVVAELRFGFASERLAKRMIEAGESIELPVLPRLPSGRVDRRGADAWFDRQRVVVEADPERWQGWFRLAQAYDLAGDRKRARAALREAIEKAR